MNKKYFYALFLFFILIYIFLNTSLVFANFELEEKNKTILNQLKESNNFIDLACYKKRTDESFEIHAHYPSSEKSRSAVQYFKYNNDWMSIKVRAKNEKEIDIAVGTQNEIFFNYSIPKEFINFNKDMLNLKHAVFLSYSLNLDLNFLKSINCYYGPKNYFSKLNGNSVVSMHYTSVYWKPIENDFFIQYFLNYYRDQNSLVLLDGYTLSNGERVEVESLTGKKEVALLEKDKILSLIHTEDKNTQYRIARAGRLHLNLTNFSSVIVGGFYNMCTTRFLGHVARALYSNPNLEEYTIYAPTTMNFIQPTGVTKEVSFKKEENIRSITDLLEASREKYNNFNKQHKVYIESKADHLVEVIFNDEEPKTNKKVLRIEHIFPPGVKNL